MEDSSKIKSGRQKKQYDFAKLERLYYQTPRLPIRIIANTLGINSQIITNLVAAGKLRHRTGVSYPTSDETAEKLKRIGVLRLNDNKTWKAVAEEFGVTIASIHLMVKKHVPELLEQRRYPDYVDALIELYNKGEYNLNQIGTRLNRDRGAVERLVRDLIDDGIIDEEKFVTVKHAFSEKQQEKLLKIDMFRKQGITWPKIAKEFGLVCVCSTSLTNIGLRTVKQYG